jgi:hypothetical protein
MRYVKLWLIPAAAVIFLTAGCYTQFYRPDMESARTVASDSQLYTRYDSTAIDTTLRRDTSDVYDRYPDDYGWNYWGRPRGYTRWGFDFNNFDPAYYWTYYGYYDYYGRPWWYNYYDARRGWWTNNPPVTTGPAEPPSKRRGRLGDSPGSGESNVTPAPPPPTTPSNVQPAPASPPPQNNGNSNNGDNQQKRSGRKGG